MHFRNQLILAAVLFGLGTFAYWNEYKRRPETEKAEQAAKKILALKGVTIASLEIEREGVAYRFLCEDLAANLCKVNDPSHWRIEIPLKTKADDTNVNNALTSIANWEPMSAIDLSKDTDEKRKAYLKDYGLDPLVAAPKGRVRVKDSAGLVRELIVGAKHPVSEAHFAVLAENGAIKDDKVFLLETYLWAATDHDLTYWRDKKILSSTQAEIQEVEILSAANKNIPVVLKKDESQLWTVTSQGRTLPGDSDAIGSLVSAALFLNAKGIYSESKDSAPAKALLSSAKKVIELRLKTPSQEERLFIYEKALKDGKNKASLAFAVQPGADPLYEIETTALDRLTKSFDELKIARLVQAMDRFALAWLEFERGDQKKTLTQTNGKWTDAGKEFDPGRLNALLDLLTTRVIGVKVLERASVTPPKDALRMKFGMSPTDIRYDYLVWKSGPDTLVLDQRNSTMPAFNLTAEAAANLPFDVLAITKEAPKKSTAGDSDILMDASDKNGQE